MNRPMNRPLRLRRSSFGATLAEGITAVGIAGMFLSIVPGFYFSSLKIWQRGTGRLGAVQRADFALRRTHDDIRNARAAVLSTDGTALALILPQKAHDAELGRSVNALDAEGSLTDGDIVQYSFTPDPHGTGSRGGAIYRRVVHPDGTEEPPRLVADSIYPDLNPVDSDGANPQPLFSYDPDLREVTITVTAAEPKPSAGTFAARHPEPKCSRCGGELSRLPASGSSPGEIQCTACGSGAEPTAEIVTYQTQLMLRNQ